MGEANGKGKRRTFMTYRVDAYMREKFLSGKGLRRPCLRENCGETCSRGLSFCKFCVVCSASLVQVLAPYVLFIVEVVAVTLIYLLATRGSLVIHEQPSKYHFSFFHSLEDIVGLSLVRCSLLSGTYTWGMQRMQSLGGSAHRPYLYASYLLAASCFPYILVKTFMFRYGGDAVASAAILIITASFTWFHVFAARRTVEWARRSYSMGALTGNMHGSGGSLGLGSPWPNSPEDVEGGANWNAMRRPDPEEMSKTNDAGALGARSGGGANGAAGGSGEDVPAECLADDDSRFMDVFGIKVHYKEVSPLCLAYGSNGGGAAATCACAPQCPANSCACSRASQSNGSSCSDVDDAGAPAAAGSSGASTAIVLLHGYGGGVFAWRHVMEALALQCQCRVVAFDRPAFGLTSRPIVSPEQRHGSGNPYSLDFQSELTMQLCAQLGLKRVLLVAHADACLLALKASMMSGQSVDGPAAAAAAASAGLAPSSGVSSPPQGTLPPGGPSGSSHGSSHAFSVVYSSSYAALGSCPAPMQPMQPSASLTASMAAAGVLPPPHPGAPSCSSSSWQPPLSSRTVLRMRAQAGAQYGDGRDAVVSPLRSPRSSADSPPTAVNAAAFAAAAASTGANPAPHIALLCGLPPLPPLPLPAHAHAPWLASDGPSDPCSPPSLTGASSSALPHPDHCRSASLLSRSSSIEPPFSPCDGPAASYAAAAAAAWADDPYRSVEADGTGVAPAGPSNPEPCGPPVLHSSMSAGPRSLGGLHASAGASFSTLAAIQGQPGPRHRRTLSSGASGALQQQQQQQQQQIACVSSSANGSCQPLRAHWPWPSVLGLALLHPNLAGNTGPTLVRLLASSGFARSLLRPLLRSELGEVASRRCWHHAERLTSDVLDLYKAPLRVEGWDKALIEVARLSHDQTVSDVPDGLRIGCVARGGGSQLATPTLLLTAAHDAVSTPARLDALCRGSLSHARVAVLPGCGHLSHEEAPGALLEHLVPFCGQALTNGAWAGMAATAAAAAGQQQRGGSDFGA